MTTDERDALLSKLQAFYQPLLLAQRTDEAKARVLAEQTEAEWNRKRTAVLQNFAADQMIVDQTALKSATQPTVDEVSAMAALAPAPKLG
jgi:hypothetical protein